MRKDLSVRIYVSVYHKTALLSSFVAYISAQKNGQAEQGRSASKMENMKFFFPQIAKNGIFSLDKPAPMEYDRSISFIMAKNSYHIESRNTQ